MALDERLLPGSAFAGETLEKNLERILAIIDALDALPAVTAEDNGKILKVVNGAWAAASAE